MPSYKLCYFNARGFAEISRWVFAVAGQEYEDVRWEREDWPKHKPNSPTGQAPWLEVDGKKIAQSTAVARYLAKQFGLAGKSDWEQAQVDMVAGCEDDFVGLFRPLFHEEDAEKKATIKKKLTEEGLPAALERYENLLKANKGGDGYFVGDGITWCDMQVTIGLDLMKVFECEEALNGYPKLKALRDRVEGHPKIAEWVAKRPETQF